MAPSIWQLLLVVLVIALPAIGVWSEKSDKRMGRLEFLGIYLGYTIGGVILVRIAQSIDFVFGMTVTVLYILGSVLVARVVVQRARQAGHSKGICYLYAIPLISYIFTLYLFFAPPKAQPEDPEALKETFS